MRTTLIAATSALLLLAGPAVAQVTSGPGSPTAPRGSPGTPAATPAPAAKQPMPDPMKQEDVSQIKGAAVYGSDGKKVGSITTVLMNPDSKQLDRLVIGEGGVLGIGTHDVAVPVDQFSWDANKGGFTIAKTADELKAMPEWKVAKGEAGTSGSGSSTPSPAPAANGGSPPK